MLENHLEIVSEALTLNLKCKISCKLLNFCGKEKKYQGKKMTKYKLSVIYRNFTENASEI